MGDLETAQLQELVRKMLRGRDYVMSSARAALLAHGAFLISAVAFISTSNDAEATNLAKWIVQSSALGIFFASLAFDQSPEIKPWLGPWLAACKVIVLIAELLVGISLVLTMHAFWPE